MFAYFRKKKLEAQIANAIGTVLHRQIYDALHSNEKQAEANLQTPFGTGYLYGFIRFGFVHHGIPGESAADRKIKQILNGVIPGKLANIFSRQLAAIELAKQLQKTEHIAAFEHGVEVGASDAGSFATASDERPKNLFRFLVGQELQYTPIPELRGAHAT